MLILKRKLASRKFWTMIVGLVSSILVIFNVDHNTTAQITAIITSFSSVVIYILAEAYVDANRELVVKEEQETEGE